MCAHKDNTTWNCWLAVTPLTFLKQDMTCTPQLFFPYKTVLYVLPGERPFWSTVHQTQVVQSWMVFARTEESVIWDGRYERIRLGEQIGYKPLICSSFRVSEWPLYTMCGGSFVMFACRFLFTSAWLCNRSPEDIKQKHEPPYPNCTVFIWEDRETWLWLLPLSLRII